MAYRSTPQAPTGRTPAELMLGMLLRNRLDLLKPNLAREIREKQQEQVERSQKGNDRRLEVGESVLVRDYRRAQQWREEDVIERQGSKHYLVQVQDEVWLRHIDQIVCLPGVRPPVTDLRKINPSEHCNLPAQDAPAVQQEHGPPLHSAVEQSVTSTGNRGLELDEDGIAATQSPETASTAKANTEREAVGPGARPADVIRKTPELRTHPPRERKPVVRMNL